MNKFSRDLLQSLAEAADFVEGKTEGARVHANDCWPAGRSRGRGASWYLRTGRKAQAAP